ncbi:MAG TPA: cytochrome b/b6 domain-containing protein, partial [Rhizomicrobium sp.]|nr:cytochrome b/b6 domain-containing protein [Rhizomicrobium sp.]
MPDDPALPRVKVWDAPTRLFHWSIVLLVFVSWFSADRGLMTIHLWSGLSLLALLLFRIAWGIMGSTTARFSDFMHPPRNIAGYLKGLARGEKRLHAGHNPAGGVMVVVMIAALLAQAVTGLFSNDGLRFNGPLAMWISQDISDQVTRIHGTIFNIILLLVWCHVVAIGFYLLVRDDNLVGPMFSGKKPRSHV